MGIRNWTCSGSLSEKTKKDKPIKSPTSRYFLKGVLSALTGFRSSHRTDSISLFSAKTAKEKSNKQKKEKSPEPEKLGLSFSTASQITKAYLKFPGGFKLAKSKSNIESAKKEPYNTKMKYPGKEAYHFPAGPSHTSPCMDPYFRSPEYQAKKGKWRREAGITAGITILMDHDREEKPDDEDNETERLKGVKFDFACG